MIIRRTLFLAVAVTALACGTSKGPSSTSISPSTNVPGVWLEAIRSCVCSSPLMATPECSAADCTEANTLVLNANGVGETLILRWSDVQGTFSAVGGSGAVLGSHWRLLAGDNPQLAQTFDATKTTFITGVQCTAAHLVRTDKDTYQRAPDSLDKAVLGAGTSRWTAIAYR
jgi:hypothetical protein